MNKSEGFTLADGKEVAWIDEDQNPFTGDWIARTILRRKDSASQRGKDYNHSTFCDLVISGLAGLRPRGDDIVVVNPLAPEDTWNYFCLDRVPYHGRMVTILWDLSELKKTADALVATIRATLRAEAKQTDG